MFNLKHHFILNVNASLHCVGLYCFRQFKFIEKQSQENNTLQKKRIFGRCKKNIYLLQDTIREAEDRNRWQQFIKSVSSWGYDAQS